MIKPAHTHSGAASRGSRQMQLAALSIAGLVCLLPPLGRAFCLSAKNKHNISS